MLDGGNAAAYGFVPMLLDYPIAFGLMGLAGAFRKMKNVKTGLALGMVMGCFGRFAASFASGVVFYGAYAPEGWNPVWYSLVYNGTYMGAECIICAVLTLMVGERLVRELRKGQ
jgi:thiamine transporter